MNNSYVYVSFRPNGIPFYVGKGTGDRYKRKHGVHYNNIVELAGGDVPVVKIKENISEDDAYKLEELFIRAIGIERDGGPLINQGYGGRGGPCGVKQSDEWKAVRKTRAKEVWRRPEYREKMLRPDRGRSGNKQPRSLKFKTDMSNRLIGNQHTIGRKRTEKEINDQKARWQNKEWREKEMARRRASGMYSPAAVIRRAEVRRINKLERVE